MIFSTGDARHKSMPLKQYSQADFKTAGAVTFDYKVFTKKDCNQKYLGAKNIINKGYQTVQITIKNNSKNDINLSLSDFSFPCISSDEVASKLHRNGLARGFGFGIGAILGNELSVPSSDVLLIPAVIQGFGANDYNDQIDNDFSKKELRDQTIPAGKSATGLIFVSRENFRNDFRLTAQDAKKTNRLQSHHKKLDVLSNKHYSRT